MFSLSAGCACYPNDRDQALCLQHIERSTPLGAMTRVAHESGTRRLSPLLTVLGYAIVLQLAACSSWQFERSAGGITTKITRSGFASDVSADNVSIKWTPDGAAEIRIQGGSSEQTKALEAVARGAVAGAKGGL